MLSEEVTTLTEYIHCKELIQALKYDRSIRSAHVLATVLAAYLRRDITSRRQHGCNTPLLLIPVPLDAIRHRERGYSQIEIVIDALPQGFKDGSYSRISTQLLARTRRTHAQTKLTRAARLSNVDGAFAVTDPDSLRGTHVYLIDDVATTGATLVNAGKPLKKAGATVTLLALTRA